MAETTNTFKHKIVVEGEKEYKAAMTQNRQALAENRSEMRAAKAEFAGQEESVESLQAQIDILTRQYATNEAQCRTLEEYLEKTAKAFGENSREASDVRIKLNNARAAMSTTGNELSGLRIRLDAVSDASEDAGSAVKDAQTDIKGIGDSAQEVLPGVSDLAEELANLAETKVGELVVGIGGAAGAAKLYADALTLGDTTVQAWGHMAAYTGATGTALEDMKTAATTVFRDAFGENLDEAAQGVATISQNLGSVGDALVTDTESAFMLRDVFGWDIPESARTASQLMTTFGIDSEAAFNLMARAAQDGADKNNNLLDTLNEYAPYFEEMGKDAGDMEAALSSAAENGIYDVDKIGDAWKEFSLRLTDGSDSTTEALTALGFNAEDVTRKIAGGGDAADLATKQIIEALAQTEDPYERNRLGIALFGTQWEDTGGRILGVFAEMESGARDNRDALQEIADVRYADLDTALVRLKNRLSSMFAEFTTPGAQVAAAFINGVNAAIDSGNVADIWNVGSGIIAQRKTAERENLMAQGYTEEEAIRAQMVGDSLFFDEGVTLVDWIKDFFASDEAGAATEAQTQAAGAAQIINSALDKELGTQLDETAKGYAQSHKAAVMTQLGAAYGEAGGEDFEAWKTFQQGMIDSAYEGNVERAGRLGEDTALATTDAIELASPQAQAAGEALGMSAADGIESTEGDAENAGEHVGRAGQEGLEDGIGDGYDIGANYGAAVAAGIRSKNDSVRAAASALGGAANAGTRATLQIHSPSRVGLATGDNYGSSVAEGIKKREADVAAAGELLGRAADAGTRQTAGFAPEGVLTRHGGQMNAMSEETLSSAFRRALSGMAIQIDGMTAGYLLEQGVSVAEYDRAAATVSGRSAGLRI